MGLTYNEVYKYAVRHSCGRIRELKMKKMMVTFLIALVSLGAFAGELTWETDMTKAKQIADKEGKAILVNFTGSDWCGWCKRLDREVFDQETFKKFAEEKLVLLKVDFPRYKKLSEEETATNQALARNYKVQGFPTIFLVDAEEKVLLQTGYRRGGPQAYVDHLVARMK